MWKMFHYHMYFIILLMRLVCVFWICRHNLDNPHNEYLLATNSYRNLYHKSYLTLNCSPSSLTLTETLTSTSSPERFWKKINFMRNVDYVFRFNLRAKFFLSSCEFIEKCRWMLQRVVHVSPAMIWSKSRPVLLSS